MSASIDRLEFESGYYDGLEISKEASEPALTYEINRVTDLIRQGVGMALSYYQGYLRGLKVYRKLNDGQLEF